MTRKQKSRKFWKFWGCVVFDPDYNSVQTSDWIDQVIEASLHIWIRTTPWHVHIAPDSALIEARKRRINTTDRSLLVPVLFMFVLYISHCIVCTHIYVHIQVSYSRIVPNELHLESSYRHRNRPDMDISHHCCTLLWWHYPRLQNGGTIEL